jgi:hypothetical protein
MAQVQQQPASRVVAGGNQKITVEGQSVDLHNVQQVSLQPPILRREYGYVAIGLGLLLAVIGYIVWQGVFLTPMLGGITLIVVGAVLLWKVQTAYTVRLLRKDGQHTLLQFPDMNTARRALQQLQGALRP